MDKKNILFVSLFMISILSYSQISIVDSAYKYGSIISPTYESNDCVNFMVKFLEKIGLKLDNTTKNNIKITNMSFFDISKELENYPEANDVSDEIRGIQHALVENNKGLPIPTSSARRGDLIQYWTVYHDYEYVRTKRKDSVYVKIDVDGFEDYKLTEYKEGVILYERQIVYNVYSGHCGIILETNSNKMKILSSHPSTNGFGTMIIDIPKYSYVVRLNPL